VQSHGAVRVYSASEGCVLVNGEAPLHAPFMCSSGTSAGSLKKKSKIVSSIHGDQIFTVRHLSIRGEGMKRFFCVHPPFALLRLVMSGGGDAKSVAGRAKRIAATVVATFGGKTFFYNTHPNCVKGRERVERKSGAYRSS
jgi:hypothetical protein